MKIEYDLTLEDSPYLLDQHGPVFILGCPRSGTTFLSRCVGSVEEIEEFVGVLAPPRMMHLIGMYAFDGKETDQLLMIMRDIFWQAFWRRRHFTSEKLAQAFTRRKISVLARSSSLDGFLFCYKEPFSCFAIKQILEYFPNSKFIHIIRDGRDNADSMERSYPNALSDAVLSSKELSDNKNSEIGIPRAYGKYFLPWWVSAGKEENFILCSRYGRCVWMWQEMVSRVLAVSADLGSSRYLELRYESVVSDPNENAQKILSFLNFEASPRLLSELKKSRTTSIGISKLRQSQDKLDEAENIAENLLKRLGYL